MDAYIEIPESLDWLLADLEAPSPSIQQLEFDLARDEYGGYFDSSIGFSGDDDGGRGRLRLRVLRAIGNCSSLRSIHLNPSHYDNPDVCSVTDDEARALLEALQQSNPVLEVLDVSYCEGFGSAAACLALAGLVQSSRTLTKLDLGYVELTSEGLVTLLLPCEPLTLVVSRCSV